MKILILDDDLQRHAGFKSLLSGHHLSHSFTYSEFVSALNSEEFDLVCLDYDLDIKHNPDTVLDRNGIRSLNGADVAAWISANPDKCPRDILVHSMNPDGAEQIAEILRRIPGKNVVVKPYSVSKE